jgi:hypothetical protein
MARNPLEDVEHVGRARPADAQHDADLVMRHGDVVAFQPVVVEQDPAGHPSLQRLDQVRHGRAADLQVK